MLIRMLAGCLLASAMALTHVHASPNPSVADADAHKAFADALEALAASRLPADGSGLIGRNRRWGALYSPRFQLGAGSALRIALAADRPVEAARAFRAIEVAAGVIRADGFVPSRVPPEVGGPLSAADIASGAAFFLGDACLGVLALEAARRPNPVASADQRSRVRASLARGIEWLLTQERVLRASDRSAPNRLLFDARAFQACGALVAAGETRAATRRAAASFVAGALARQAGDGHFLEGEGHDTSYQGVALRVGEDVMLAGYRDPGGRLRSALTRAAEWLARRVDPDGRIDSSGNARTCAGGETWLGRQKRVDVADVFAGLAYASVRTRQASLADAARRVAAWMRANPGADPCFP